MGTQDGRPMLFVLRSNRVNACLRFPEYAIRRLTFQGRLCCSSGIPRTTVTPPERLDEVSHIYGENIRYTIFDQNDIEQLMKPT